MAPPLQPNPVPAQVPRLPPLPQLKQHQEPGSGPEPPLAQAQHQQPYPELELELEWEPPQAQAQAQALAHQQPTQEPQERPLCHQ